VLNPWSVLSVLQRQELGAYWMATGTPTMLVRLLRERRTAPEDLECVRADSSVLEAFDVERIDAVLETPDRVCILEFKLGSAESALAQIQRRKYFESWLGKGKELLLVGVGGFERRQIECRWRRIE